MERFSCDEHTMELVIVRKWIEFCISFSIIISQQAADGEDWQHFHIYRIIFPTMTDVKRGELQSIQGVQQTFIEPFWLRCCSCERNMP